MIVYRISKQAYINDLNGIGAGMYGGRWNPKGINLCYTSGSIALAYLEFYIHNFHLLSTTHVCLAKISIGKPAPLLEYTEDQLPENWDTKLSAIYGTQEIGKQFVLNSDGYILKVPSAIVPGEYNYLLNPNHGNHKYTVVEQVVDPLSYDPRLIDIAKD
ncbi:MAG: RES family NAD+ phosphorylase [Cyclobacteriaceae bacterium]